MSERICTKCSRHRTLHNTWSKRPRATHCRAAGNR